MTEETQSFEQQLDAFYPTEESEPLEAPTEEAVKDETPAEEVEDSNDDETTKAEDEAEEEKPEDDDVNEEGDILVYEINEKEYTAKDIERLETKGKELQADYTRKTQVLADERKTGAEQISEAITKTNDLAAQLEVLVGEDKEIDWKELKEDDPDEYIRLQERAQKRDKVLTDIKANNQVSNQSNVDYEAVRSKLVENNPDWLDDKNKETKVYYDDMELFKDYVTEWTDDDVKRVGESATLFQLVMDDVKRKSTNDVASGEKESTRKKIIATPKARKPKASTNKNMSDEEKFYGNN